MATKLKVNGREVSEAEARKLLEGQVAPDTVTLGGEFVALAEKAVRTDDTIEIKLIQPGWNSSTSRHYPADVLERDGATAFPKGTHMYWNHPTATEAIDRPERDLNDFAAVLVSDARYVKDHPLGEGLYANAEVRSRYRDDVDELAEHIGVSIRAGGVVRQGEIDGHFGAIVERIVAGPTNSVDFVTKPGAGGQIRQLFEAAGRDVAVTEAHGFTHNELRDLLHTALRNVLIGEDDDRRFIWVRDFTDTWVVYDDEGADAPDEGSFRMGYTVSDEGAVTFTSQPEKVVAHTEWRPAPTPDSTPAVPVVVETTEAQEADMDRAQVEALIAESIKPHTDRITELGEAVTTLTTENAALKTDNARLNEAEQMRVAHKRAIDSFNEGGVNYAARLQLPAAVINRVCEAAAKTVPLTDDGKFDAEAFDKSLTESLAAEADYLHKAGLLSSGDIADLGESNADAPDVAALLEAEFASLPGMTEDLGKAAAAGRS